MSRTLLTTLLIIFSFSYLYTQVTDVSETTRRIETYLNQLEKVGFSGSVLVELDKQKIISKGFGYRNIELFQKNTAETIFDIGSVTKQFTAAAVLKLEMQGKLSTTDKLSMYFENLPKEKENITIHDLLRHQSGLESNVGRDYEKISQADFIDKVMNSQLRFDIGTRFSYSNIGYSLLAIIIEKVSGTDYENFLYENLLKPAGLEFTGYTRPGFDTSTIAVGYYRDDKVWGKPTEQEWDKTAPYWHLKGNGGILSSVEDLYKWHLALMSENILSKEAKNKLYNPVLRHGENENPYYAYGWDVRKTKSNTLLVQHNGSNGIFYADFNRFIDENIVTIMLSNKFHLNFNGLNNEIAKIIFDKNYIPVIPVAENQANTIFTEKIISKILNDGLEAAKKEYEGRDSDTNILEYILNKKGYDLLSKNEIEQAILIFEMNTFAFPESANAFDSLAEAFMEKGDNDLAIEYYKKSLMLDPDNMNAEEMLLKLEK